MAPNKIQHRTATFSIPGSLPDHRSHSAYIVVPTSLHIPPFLLDRQRSYSSHHARYGSITTINLALSTYQFSKVCWIATLSIPQIIWNRQEFTFNNYCFTDILSFPHIIWNTSRSHSTTIAGLSRVHIPPLLLNTYFTSSARIASSSQIRFQPHCQARIRLSTIRGIPSDHIPQ